MSTPQERRALVRVVSGDPDDAELAALTVVLAAAAGDLPAARGPASTWADRASQLRRPAGGGTPPAGPHGWRMSTWPR